MSDGKTGETAGRGAARGLSELKPPGRHDGWTQAQMALFFDTLAATCNVTRSATAAGMDLSWVYKRRRRDAAFAAAWAEAMHHGETRLEARLMQHALGGADEPFDPALAIRVLATRDARDRREPPAANLALMPIDRLEALLLRRLAALEKRLAARGEGRA